MTKLPSAFHYWQSVQDKTATAREQVARYKPDDLMPTGHHAGQFARRSRVPNVSKWPSGIAPWRKLHMIALTQRAIRHLRRQCIREGNAFG
jgi:hypothetical protein